MKEIVENQWAVGKALDVIEQATHGCAQILGVLAVMNKTWACSENS
jgi:hypothetical protein